MDTLNEAEKHRIWCCCKMKPIRCPTLSKFAGSGEYQ